MPTINASGGARGCEGANAPEILNFVFNPPPPTFCEIKKKWANFMWNHEWATKWSKLLTFWGSCPLKRSKPRTFWGSFPLKNILPICPFQYFDAGAATVAVSCFDSTEGLLTQAFSTIQNTEQKKSNNKTKQLALSHYCPLTFVRVYQTNNLKKLIWLIINYETLFPRLYCAPIDPGYPLRTAPQSAAKSMVETSGVYVRHIGFVRNKTKTFNKQTNKQKQKSTKTYTFEYRPTNK